MTTMCNQFLTVDLLMYPPLVPMYPVASSNRPIFQFGFSTQAIVFSHSLPKNCWLPFLKDLQGFNLSAGSLVRLPKDCDAHLILARLRPSTFTYYWSADPVNLRQLLDQGTKSSQSKLTPSPWCDATDTNKTENQ